MRTIPRNILAILLSSTILMATPSLARESDLTKPIDVRADKSEFDESAGTQTLSGNVEISQGTMRIKANKISITLKNNALHTISGTGSPIKFEQQNEAGELMQGEASNLHYDAIAGTLTLEGSAKLSQPRQNLNSERIVFDSRSQKVSAEGGGASGRVNIQILPPSAADSK